MDKRQIIINQDLEIKSDTVDFIKKNLETNYNTVLLSNKNNNSEVDLKLAVSTIQARGKIKNKIPSWYAIENLIYPNSLNVEQSSSELTADFRSKLQIFKDFEPKLFKNRELTKINKSEAYFNKSIKVADFTGGLGVDSYFISKEVKTLDYYEKDNSLARHVRWNFTQLNANNVNCYTIDINQSSINNIPETYDIIYLDPARRGKNSERVYGIQDCEPNLIILKEEILSKCKLIISKLSPMIDISESLKQLKTVKELLIISVKNECKELLFIIEEKTKHSLEDIPIRAINLYPDKDSNNPLDYIIDEYSFTIRQEQESIVSYIDTKDIQGKLLNSTENYLFEPNKSILKGGAFKKICSDYGLSKLDKHTHLYFGESKINFPGKIYLIENIYGSDKSSLKEIAHRYPTAEITTKNYPISNSDLRKKLKIKDGSAVHLFAIKSNCKNYILATKKL